MCNPQRAQGPEPLRGPQPPRDSSPGDPAAGFTLGRSVTPPLPSPALPMGPDGSPSSPRRRPNPAGVRSAGRAWPAFPQGGQYPRPRGGAAAWARLCAGPGVLQVGSHSLPPPLVGPLQPAPPPLRGASPFSGGSAPRPAPAGRRPAEGAGGPGRCPRGSRLAPGPVRGPALPCPRRPRGPACSASAPAPGGPPPGRSSEGVTPGPGRPLQEAGAWKPGSTLGAPGGPGPRAWVSPLAGFGFQRWTAYDTFACC